MHVQSVARVRNQGDGYTNMYSMEQVCASSLSLCFQAMQEALSRLVSGEAFLSRLEGVTKAQKRKTLYSKHKHEWKQERLRLEAEVTLLQKEVDGLLRWNGQDADEELVREIASFENNRKLFRQEMQIHAREIKVQGNEIDEAEMTEALLEILRDSFDDIAEELRMQLTEAEIAVGEVRKSNPTLMFSHNFKRRHEDLAWLEEPNPFLLLLDNLKANDDEKFSQQADHAWKELIGVRESFFGEMKKASSNLAELQKKRRSLNIEEEVFEFVRRRYLEIVEKGRGLPLFFERLYLEMPRLQRAIIESILQFLEDEKMLHVSQKETKELFHRQYVQKRDSEIAKLRQIVKDAEERRFKEGEKRSLDEKKKEIKDRLALQREEMRIKREAEAELQALRDAHAEEEARSLTELKQLENAKKKELVEEFRENKRFEAAVENLREEMEAIEVQRRKAEVEPLLKERVEFREHQRDLKLKQRKEEELQAETERSEREQQLQILKQTNPYFRKIGEIQPSRARLEQQTFSSAVAPVAAYRDGNVDFKASGFSDDKICNDVRFKIVQALRSKGLQGSRYAQNLLSNMSKPLMERKNLFQSS